MSEATQISLKAARVNADLKQSEAADELSDYMGIKVSRQRIQKWEKHPEETPLAFARGLAHIYKLPMDVIHFAHRSTKS